MHITGSTRVFLILGDPVEQLRAAELFNPHFRRHGVDDVLVPAAVGAADLVAVVRALFSARKVSRLWLTVPHEAAPLPHLQHGDERGRAGRRPAYPAGLAVRTFAAASAGPAGFGIVVNATPRGLRSGVALTTMIQQAPAYLDFFGLHTPARSLDNDAAEVRRFFLST